MALIDSSHGGECCGIIHLSSFFNSLNWIEKDKIEYINKGIESCLYNYEGNYCDDGANCDCYEEESCGQPSKEEWQCAIEVVLNNHQILEWRKALETVGFKEFFSFHNS